MKTLEITAEKVERVYTGRDESCRCGCHGTYSTEEKKIKSMITRANGLLSTEEGAITDSCSDYINISYGNNRAICFYLKK